MQQMESSRPRKGCISAVSKCGIPERAYILTKAKCEKPQLAIGLYRDKDSFSHDERNT